MHIASSVGGGHIGGCKCNPCLKLSLNPCHLAATPMRWCPFLPLRAKNFVSDPRGETHDSRTCFLLALLLPTSPVHQQSLYLYRSITLPLGPLSTSRAMSSSHPSPSPGQVAFSNAEIVDSIVQYSSDLPALCRVNTTCFDIASTKLYLDIGTNYDPHLSEWEEQTPASSFLLVDLPIFRPLRGRAVSAVRAAVRESLLRRVKNLSVGTFA